MANMKSVMLGMSLAEDAIERADRKKKEKEEKEAKIQANQYKMQQARINLLGDVTQRKTATDKMITDLMNDHSKAVKDGNVEQANRLNEKIKEVNNGHNNYLGQVMQVSGNTELANMASKGVNIPMLDKVSIGDKDYIVDKDNYRPKEWGQGEDGKLYKRILDQEGKYSGLDVNSKGIDPIKYEEEDMALLI
jgi:hypothetical protein